MTERPVLFNAAMVQAVLAGTKTQTRRAIRPAPDIAWPGEVRQGKCSATGLVARYTADDQRRGRLAKAMHCPFGEPGDRLWVREAWRSGKLADRFPPRELTPHVIWLEADGAAPAATNGKLRPGMFMPRWASRLVLEVTEVRVQRLSQISDDEAIAEGIRPAEPLIQDADTTAWCHSPGMLFPSPAEAFWDLWRVLYGMESVKTDPWLWCVTFRRI